MSSGSAVFNSRYSRAVLSKSDWEDHREFIQKHYLENDKTLEDLKVLLKKDLGVEVTKHQLEYRCRRWKFRKNCSQTYPRQSQNQSVLKFPTIESKKSRLKQRGLCEPQTGLASEKIRTPQDNDTGIPNLTTPTSCQFSNDFLLSDVADLSSYPTMLNGHDGYTGTPKQAEVYSSIQKTSYNSLLSDGREPYEVEDYKPTNPHGSQPLCGSPSGFDSVEYHGDSRLPFGQNIETIRGSLQQRDFKSNVWPQRLSEENPIFNANGAFRNDIPSSLDPNPNTWALPNAAYGGFPYQDYDEWAGPTSTRWIYSQPESDVCAAPLLHLPQSGLESPFLISTNSMMPARGAGFGYSNGIWNGTADKG
ncbi:hypothetical protein TWF281_001085 [Arthrobotrys megalospora]